MNSIMNDRRIMLSVNEITDLGGVEVTDLLDMVGIPIKELLVPIHTSAFDDIYTIKYNIVIDKQYSISEYKINHGYYTYKINNSTTLIPDTTGSRFYKSGLVYNVYVGCYSGGIKYYSKVSIEGPYKSYYNSVPATSTAENYYDIESVDKMYLPIKPRYVNVVYFDIDNNIVESIGSSSDRFSFVPSEILVTKYTVPIYYIPA